MNKSLVNISKYFGLIILLSANVAFGQGLPSISGNAGDLLWESESMGGRVATFHRGYYLTHSHTVGSAVVLDLMPLQSGNAPTIIDEHPGASNGHAWVKFGDAYRRGYSMPEFSGTQFVDLTDMTNITPFTGSLQFDYSCEACPVDNDRLGTYPYAYYPWSNQIKDVRRNQLFNGAPDLSAGLGLGGEIMIGNLLFSLPLGPVDGLAIWDTSDPTNLRLLSLLTNPLSNYPDGWSVYRNHIILTTGDDSNEGDQNMVAIDFSDPTSPNVAFGFDVSEIGPARYSVFQDNYGFVANGNQWHKIDMENRTVESFTSAGSVNLGDFWPMAMGNIVSFIEGQTFGDRIAFFLHSPNPDDQGPSVGYHVPSDGQTGYSRFAGVGLVINECLAGETVNTSNIVVTRCTDNAAISGTVSHTSYGTIQWVSDQPLEENMSYTLSVSSGLRDCAGNGANPYSFSFTTGSDIACEGGGGPINTPPIIDSYTASNTDVNIDQELTLTVLASDADGDALEYRWDFDDGSVLDWSSQSSVSHTYATNGNFRAIVQVRDDEATTSSFVLINVSATSETSQNVHSTPIVLGSDGRLVWVVNPDNNSISSIDVDDLTQQSEIPVGQDPTSLAFDSEGNLWIACRDEDEVWVIDPDTGTTLERISLGRGSRPYGIVRDPNRSFMYVSEFGSGNLSKIPQDLSQISNIAELVVGPYPRALAINGMSDQLVISRMISGNSQGTIYLVDLSVFSTESSISLPIDETSPPTSGVAGPGIPNYVSGVAFNPTGTQLSYVSKKDNIFNGTHGSRNGVNFTFERTVRSIIGQIDQTSMEETVEARIDIDDMAQPSSVTYGPNGNSMIVTMQGNNLLIVLDANSGSEVSRTATGLAPQGSVVDPVTRRIFSKDFMGRTVTVFDGTDALSGIAGPMSILATISTVENEVLGPDVLQGKRIFYNSDDPRMTQQGDNDNGYITCATCHIDGTHDGRVWDFTQRGEGLRNTTSLVGRSGEGHGRVHWTGNFDEIHDFEHDIRNEFGGSGFMSDIDFEEGSRNTTLGDTKEGLSSDLDALTAYMRSLNSFDPSPFKPSDLQFSEQALRGKLLFQEMNCAYCHSGQSFTNSGQNLIAEVGTLTGATGSRLGGRVLGLDVPTLKDIWFTSPYLHDGSALSLEAVMNEHLGFESLSNQQRDDLIEYLNQLDDTESDNRDGVELRLINPVNGVEVGTESTITLEIQTNLDVNEIETVTYYANQEIIATTSTSPFSSTWSTGEEGNYDLQVMVRLTNGMSIGTADFQTTVDVSEQVITGIEEWEIDLTIYPNPVGHVLNISGDIPMGSVITLHNLTGRKVYSAMTVQANSHRIYTSGLSSGVYMLRVGSNPPQRFIIR